MKKIQISSIFLILFAIIFTGCTKSLKTSENKLQENDIKWHSLFVIKNVNIIPMTKENNLIKNATIVIKDKKILSINEPIPNGAKIIDGKGKWLIPGLIDMHVHNLSNGSFSQGYPTRGSTLIFETQNLMTPYITNGVTTIFELSGRICSY